MKTERISDLKFFLRALVDDVLAPIFIMDENREIIAYNNAVLSLFKITGNKLANKKIGEIFGCLSFQGCDDSRTSEMCMDCELNKLVVKAIKQKQAIENEIIKKTFYMM
jgi:transcriptional regulator with PAS, ATPase and Fis domain